MPHARLTVPRQDVLVCIGKKWQGQQGSNPRPTVLETVALPAELYPYGRGLMYDLPQSFARVDSQIFPCFAIRVRIRVPIVQAGKYPHL